jgi:hypothetical protein
VSCNNFVDCLLSALCGILIDEKVMYRVSSGPKDTPLTVIVLHRRLMNIYFVINDFNLSSSLVAFIGVFFEPSPLFTIPFSVHITGGNTVYCCTGLICITLTKLELCITRETLCNPIGIIVSGCQGGPLGRAFRYCSANKTVHRETHSEHKNAFVRLCTCAFPPYYKML